MSTQGAEERLVELRGQGLGDGTSRILQLAEQLGYSVATAGPGSYRLARTRRKLARKQTESVLVSVYDDRGGTKARFVGPVDPALLEHLGNGATAGSADVSAPLAQQSATSGVPTPSQPQPTASAMGISQSMPLPIERPAPRPVAGPASGLISSVPGGAARSEPLPPPPAAEAAVIRGETADVDELTIANVRRESVETSSTGPGLLLPGGRFVPLTTPIVIGRGPDAARGAAGAVAVPVAEQSLSKTHVAVALDADGISVTDLHSSNGTVIDDGGTRRPCVPGTAVTVPRGAAIIAGAVVFEVVGP